MFSNALTMIVEHKFPINLYNVVSHSDAFRFAFSFTLLGPMKLSINFDKVKSGWPIIYIEWSKFIISENAVFFSLKIDFVLANNTDPDEMPQHASFHLDLHCLPKYTFWNFWFSKG